MNDQFRAVAEDDSLAEFYFLTTCAAVIWWNIWRPDAHSQMWRCDASLGSIALVTDSDEEHWEISTNLSQFVRWSVALPHVPGWAGEL